MSLSGRASNFQIQNGEILPFLFRRGSDINCNQGSLFSPLRKCSPFRPPQNKRKMEDWKYARFSLSFLHLHLTICAQAGAIEVAICFFFSGPKPLLIFSWREGNKSLIGAQETCKPQSNKETQHKNRQECHLSLHICFHVAENPVLITRTRSFLVQTRDKN